MSKPPHVKILFQLTQDDDEYPPFAVEGIWATRAVPEGYTLDNIPFFVREATLGDTVAAKEAEGALWFSGVLVRSSNSLFRVVLFDAARADELHRHLIELGCSTEGVQHRNLVAVNVPESATLSAVQAYLHTESRKGWLDYEEAILRQ